MANLQCDITIHLGIFIVSAFFTIWMTESIAFLHRIILALVFSIPLCINLFSAAIIAQTMSSSPGISAARYDTDSLKRVLSGMKNDTNRVNTLNILAFELRGNAPRERAKYANEALMLSRGLGFRHGEAQALMNLGGAKWEQGDYAKALELHQTAAQMNENLGDRQSVANSYNSLGLIYSDQGNYSRALEYFLQSLMLREAIGDKRGKQMTLGNIGTIYRYQGERSSALQYYTQALNIAEEIQDKRGKSIALTNIGMLWYEQGKYDTTLQYYTQALHISEEINSSGSIAFVLNSIGLVLAKQGALDRALDCQRRAYSIARNLGLSRITANALLGMASAHASRREYAEAIRVGKEALDTAQSVGLASVTKDAAKLIADGYAAMGKYKEALKQYMVFKQMSDSAQSVESSKIIARLEARYKMEHQEAENKRLQAELAAGRAESEQRRILIIAVLTVLALVAVLAALLAWSNRRKNVDNTELQRQQELLEEQAREIEIANTRLQEQNFVLHELNHEKNEFLGIAAHDLKTPLVGIILSTQILRRGEGKFSSEERLTRLEGMELIAKRMQEIIAHLLDVNAIESGGIELQYTHFSLEEIVCELALEYREIAAYKNIHIEHPEQPLHSSFVYADKARTREVIDNLLSNAVKYSPSQTRVVLRLEETNVSVRCSVQDEGPGLTDNDKQRLFRKFARLSAKPTAGEHSTGLGLSIAKRLIEMMHGRIWCESEPGCGATFIIELPKMPHHSSAEST